MNKSVRVSNSLSLSLFVFDVHVCLGINDAKVHQYLSKPGEIKEEYLTELQKVRERTRCN